jgi:hypothetical protein
MEVHKFTKLVIWLKNHKNYKNCLSSLYINVITIKEFSLTHFPKTHPILSLIVEKLIPDPSSLAKIKLIYITRKILTNILGFCKTL